MTKESQLNESELEQLIELVFQPGPDDHSLAFLVDLPDAVSPDNPSWTARRETAFSWFRALAARQRDTSWKPCFFLYRNVRSDNADFPAGAWPFEGDSLPGLAEDLAQQGQVGFDEILASHSLFLVLTEFSASAPLRVAARTHHFRAASMPGFRDDMIPALRLDFNEIHREVEVLRDLLDRAIEARLLFGIDSESKDLALTLDLRHRRAHASSGLLGVPGSVGNLPSGEAFIVPYEGEREGDPSRSQGVLPVQLEDEVVLYRIVKNHAVGVESTGPISDAQRELLEREPAFGNLAELGLGVLANFGLLPIGENLLDEKLGLHIAFGRSDHFGGQTAPAHFSSPEEVVHIDRVYIPEVQPRVSVRRLSLHLADDTQITLIEEGRFIPIPLTEQEQYEAFQALLSTCLKVDRKGELLVLYDEAFHPFKPALMRLVFDWQLFATFVEIPRDYQLALTEWSPSSDDDDKPAVNLPRGIATCIDHAQAILAALNGQLETNRIRRAMLAQPSSDEYRWVHIPGISSEVLQAVRKSPFDRIKSDCELLAWTLGEAKTAELTTSDSLGGGYTLYLDLGGWENEPLMSPGVLNPGSWGNIPPGETFFCPEESGVSGEVCVDGSFPGCVLRKGEEVILLFERGKLISWRSPLGRMDSPAIHFLERELREHADSNWNSFAELGIGLNPAITRLTGNALFDEKVLGTAHVAIGDNSFFGHNTKSARHTDFVLHRPSLQLDGHQVLQDGQLQYVTMQAWREEVRARSFQIPFDRKIAVREAKISEQEGLLRRKLRSGGRVGYVQMLDESGSRALALLADDLIRAGAFSLFPEDLENKTLLGHPTLQLLGVLDHYGALASMKEQD